MPPQEQLRAKSFRSCWRTRIAVSAPCMPQDLMDAQHRAKSAGGPLSAAMSRKEVSKEAQHEVCARHVQIFPRAQEAVLPVRMALHRCPHAAMNCTAPQECARSVPAAVGSARTPRAGACNTGMKSKAPVHVFRTELQWLRPFTERACMWRNNVQRKRCGANANPMINATFFTRSQHRVRKATPKRGPSSGPELAPQSVKADSRPSHFGEQILGRIAGVIFRPAPEHKPPQSCRKATRCNVAHAFRDSTRTDLSDTAFAAACTTIRVHVAFTTHAHASWRRCSSQEMSSQLVPSWRKRGGKHAASRSGHARHPLRHSCMLCKRHFSGGHRHKDNSHGTLGSCCLHCRKSTSPKIRSDH